MKANVPTVLVHDRKMAQNPGLVAQLEVLELGSGTGLCGILAAKLGAKHVIFSRESFDVFLLAEFLCSLKPMTLSAQWTGQLDTWRSAHFTAV